MEFIDLKLAEEELDNLKADLTTKELILNNIRLYNELVFDYDQGITKNLYLTYQLNVQVTKQFTELRKFSPKKGGDEGDPLSDLIKGLKPEKAPPKTTKRNEK